MDIRQLHYFIAVAKTLNFTEAAKSLYIAQSGLSQGIATLEKQLGLDLFIRDKRSVRLTPAGEVFLRDAIELVSKYEESVKRAHQVKNGLLENLRIGFLPTLGKKYMPPYICRFRREFPYINLDLRQYTMAELHTALENEMVDIGFTRPFDLQHNPEIMFKSINIDGVSLIVHKDHPLSGQTTVDLSTLSEEPFIIMSPKIAPGWYELVMQICARRGLVPRIVNSPFLMEMVCTLVATGTGMTIVPSSEKSNDVPDIHFIDLEGDDTQLDVVAAWKKTVDNPCIPLFVSILDEQY